MHWNDRTEAEIIRRINARAEREERRRRGGWRPWYDQEKWRDRVSTGCWVVAFGYLVVTVASGGAWWTMVGAVAWAGAGWAWEQS